MCREPTEKEKVELVEFANMITPSSWNVVKDQKDCKTVPGTFNVIIDILDGPTMGKKQDEEDADFHGRVKEGLRYVNGSVAEIRLEICPKWDPGVKKTIVHELSHIAVNRCQAWRLKAVKNKIETVSLDIKGETDHGSLFQRAFQVLIDKAKDLLGENDADALLKELGVYEEND